MRWLAALGTSGAAVRSAPLGAQANDATTEVSAAVDPYFLDSGALSAAEEADLIEVERLQEQMMVGRSVTIPRGLRPARAPTFRLVHWSGEVGSDQGQFVSPLRVAPELAPLRDFRAYHFNAQIVGFHGASDDWRRTRQGTLTVEIRAPFGGEEMTWFFAQPFDIDATGFTNVGYQYIAQRGGNLDPVVTDKPNVGVRIQLIREPQRTTLLFRKIIRTTLAVTGVPLQLENEDFQTALQSMPPMRIPALMQEGAALAQAVVGSMANEIPIWRGGFSTYGIAQGGSQLGLQPGYWLALDASREVDLRGVRLDERDGIVSPTRDGIPLDVNFLVLSMTIAEGESPTFFDLCSGGGVLEGQPVPETTESPRAVPKSAPPAAL
jgi:hypothetical protein